MNAILFLLILGAAPPADARDADGQRLPAGVVRVFGDTAVTLAAAFRPRDRALVTAEICRVRFRDFDTGRLKREVQLPDAFTCRQALLDGAGDTALYWSPVKVLAYGLKPRKADLQAATALPDVKSGGTILAVALSRDGSTAALAEARKERLAVRVWDPTTGRERTGFSVPAEGDPSANLALSLDGAFLAVTLTAGRKVAYSGLVRVATGKEVGTLPDGLKVQSLTFSPDGKAVAARRAGKTALHDGRTGRVRGEIDLGEELPYAEAFSPDGRLLALSQTGYRAHKIVVVELATGKVRLERDIPRSDRSAITFADGGTLVSRSWGGRPLVWDLTGRSDLREAGATTADVEGLSSRSASEAFEAMGRLVRTGDKAVSLLRARLRPAKAPPSDDQIDALVALTSDADPAVRARAGEALVAAGLRALPALRRALESGEPRRPGVERIIDDINGPPSRRALIGLRGVEVLERLASPDARRLLTELAGGHTDSDLTKDAKAALTRLEAK